MKLIDLFEAPVSDIEATGFDNEQLNFTNADKKNLINPEFQQKIIKSFGKTPYNFRIIFDNSFLSGNIGVDPVDYEGIFKAFKTDDKTIEGVKGLITLIVIHNKQLGSKSLTHLPLTPWMIAHKVGHAINSTKGDGLHKFLTKVSKKKIKRPLFYYITSNVFRKNADITKLDNFDLYISLVSEIEPEIIAQFLIDGKVTLRRNDIEEIQIQEIEDEINQYLDNLFQTLQKNGNVLISS